MLKVIFVSLYFLLSKFLIICAAANKPMRHNSMVEGSPSLLPSSFLPKRLLKKSAKSLENGNQASNPWETNSRKAVWYRPKSHSGSGVWRVSWLCMMMSLMHNPGGQSAHRREGDRSRGLFQQPPNAYTRVMSPSFFFSSFSASMMILSGDRSGYSLKYRSCPYIFDPTPGQSSTLKQRSSAM